MRTSWDEPIHPTPPASPQSGMKNCPFCAELIQAEAIKCRFCGEFLTGRSAPAPSKPGGKWFQSTPAVVLALLTVGPLALPLVWTNTRWRLPAKVLVTAAVIILTIAVCYAVVGLYAYILNQIEALGI